MTKNTIVSLVALLLACGGDSGGNGPGDANIKGTWIVTFSSNTSCSLGQIAFTLSESQTGAPVGTHGSYVISCPGSPDQQEDPGSVFTWAVSGDNFSVHVSALQFLNGTLSGGTMQGTFVWGSVAGDFTAARQ